MGRSILTEINVIRNTCVSLNGHNFTIHLNTNIKLIISRGHKSTEQKVADRTSHFVGNLVPISSRLLEECLELSILIKRKITISIVTSFWENRKQKLNPKYIFDKTPKNGPIHIEKIYLSSQLFFILQLIL